MRARRVLVLCSGNSARSQMAEGLINQELGGRWHARSAGTSPAPEVHPLAVQAMAELGIDISQQVPKHISTLASEPFDSVITVCDNALKTCPLWLGPATHIIHIGLADPALAKGTEAERLLVFRRTRDETRERVLGYLDGLA
jgi:arsenate reductase